MKNECGCVTKTKIGIHREPQAHHRACPDLGCCGTPIPSRSISPPSPSPLPLGSGSQTGKPYTRSAYRPHCTGVRPWLYVKAWCAPFNLLTDPIPNFQQSLRISLPFFFHYPAWIAFPPLLKSVPLWLLSPQHAAPQHPSRVHSVLRSHAYSPASLWFLATFFAVIVDCSL